MGVKGRAILPKRNGRPSYVQTACEAVFGAREDLGEVKSTGDQARALSQVYDQLNDALRALLLATGGADRTEP